MQDENGRRPHPYDRDDAAALVQLAHKINEQASNKIDVDEVHLPHACDLALLCMHTHHDLHAASPTQQLLHVTVLT